MKYRLLELLRCPFCHDPLNLFSFAEFEEEISEGVLACKCGSLFPITDGVPRFIDDRLAAFPDFKKKYKEKIDKIVRDNLGNGKIEANALPAEFASIRDSFSKEWSFFDYERDKTWGWDSAARQKVFLEDFGVEPAWLKGKLVLDAGCGNGALTAKLQDFNLEIIGLDLSDSIVQAQANKRKYAGDRSGFVHFVQGNLFAPPFAKESFDLIYSSGVLHHTPDTKATFLKLVPLLKKEGRAYIWVYGKRGWPVRFFFWQGRLLRKYISLKSLLAYCRLLSPFYKMMTDILSVFGIYPFRKRTPREIALDLFDAFSPPYNHTHTPHEVSGWFAQENLTNICVAGVQKHGFGVRGDKQ